jgi:threonine dehydratase
MRVMPWPLSLEDILDARQRLAPYLAPTPLRNYPVLDETVGLRVLVKHENHQPTNAFKIRNGLAAITALSPQQRRCGVVAATRGNHGLGLTWAGQRLGVPVTICVPLGNNPEKNEAIRGMGACLIEEGESYDDAVKVMDRLAHQQSLWPIHSTNDRSVLAGAGTMTLEILDQAQAMGEQIGAMVFAVGGGSQAVGAMTVLRARGIPSSVYGVQAERASAIHDSWHAGRRLTTARADTFADGIATRATYDLTFDALREGLADFVKVSEDEIADALRLILRTTHNLAEGAGAAGLAGLRKLAQTLRGKTAVVVISGANTDLPTLRRVLNETGGRSAA